MDTPTVTSPPTPIILPGSPKVDQEIDIIKLPDCLATLESNRSDVGGASKVSSSNAELADMLATPEEKTEVANDTDDCASVKLPESILNLEHTEKRADKTENRGPNGQPESPVSAPEVSTAGLVGEHVALQANQSGAIGDTARPSIANWVHDLDPSDDRIDEVRHEFSAAKLSNSPVEPGHDVDATQEVGGFVPKIQPADCDSRVGVDESQNKLLANKSSTDKPDSAGVYQKNSAVESDDRLVVAGRSGAEEGGGGERSSVSRIVDYLFAIGASIAGAPHAASEEKHDISTDEPVFPTATQQISPTLVDCPIIPEATGGEAHQAKADASTATCKDHLSTASEASENGASDMGNVSCSVQAIDGLVPSGPAKKWSSGPGNEFPTGESANNFVIPEIAEHKKTPNNANGEPLIVVSTNALAISEASDKPVDSSDGYSTDRADIGAIEDDDEDEDRRVLTACPGLLTPSSTISSQVEDFQESEDGLEEGEIREDIITVFHDAVRFNVKHPLINTWTLWYTRPSSGKVCPYSSFPPRLFSPIFTNPLSN